MANSDSSNDEIFSFFFNFEGKKPKKTPNSYQHKVNTNLNHSIKYCFLQSCQMRRTLNSHGIFMGLCHHLTYPIIGLTS